MIMVPAQNIPNKRHYNFTHHDTSVLSSLDGHETRNQTCLGSDQGADTQMDVQDDSRANKINGVASSIFKDVHEEKDQESWLQLTIGGGLHDLTSKRSNYEDNLDLRSPGCCTSIELDILPSGSYSQQTRPLEFCPPRPLLPFANISTTSLLFNQHYPTSCSNFPGGTYQDMDWSCRSVPQNTCSPSSSSYSLMPLNCVARPFQASTKMNDVGKDVAFRIMDAPPRPHSGIWFMLQASPNQTKEPFLPQLPKSNYLRIKDGKIQIRLLLKYLVSKLGLGCDSEIEITCRGQKLLPFLTMQHVRDNIWSPKDSTILLTDTDSSTTDHIMVLHYGRSV